MLKHVTLCTSVAAWAGKNIFDNAEKFWWGKSFENLERKQLKMFYSFSLMHTHVDIHVEIRQGKSLSKKHLKIIK